MSTAEIRHFHRDTQAEKVRSRKALNYAVATGKIIPQPCEKCGAPPWVWVVEFRRLP